MRERSVNAILVPSGDQSGSSASTVRAGVTFVSPLPSALTTKSRSRPPAFRTKTRRRPSGDHAGSRSFWSVVTRFGLVPSALTYQMPPVEPTEFWKAIRLPSGAHAGEVGTNPRARPITRRLSDPSGLTV